MANEGLPTDENAFDLSFKFVRSFPRSIEIISSINRSSKPMRHQLTDLTIDATLEFWHFSLLVFSICDFLLKYF